MCGRFERAPAYLLKKLMNQLRVISDISYSGDAAPTNMIQIIVGDKGEWKLIDAVWWLLLDKEGKPNTQYATFNSRSDKLESSNLTKGLYKHSRCIIPALSFMESNGPKGKKKYHKVKPSKEIFLFGGLYRTNQIGDETVYSTSIITTPPTEDFKPVHNRMPLILDHKDENLINAWLNKSYFPESGFDLSPQLPHSVEATLSEKYMSFIPAAEPFRIKASC